MGPSLTGVEGIDHQRQRKAITPSFTIQRIRQLHTVFLDKSEELSEKLCSLIRLESVSGQSPVQVDMSKLISQLTVDVIGSAAFDYEFGALHHDGNELLDAWKKMMAGNNDSRFMALLQRAGVPLTWLKVRIINSDVRRCS